MQRLELHLGRGGSITVRGAELRRLLVHSPLFSSLHLVCPLLTELALQHCSKLGDVPLRSLVSRLAGLQHLDLSFTGAVSDETLRTVGGCSQGPRLRSGTARIQLARLLSSPCARAHTCSVQPRSLSAR